MRTKSGKMRSQVFLSVTVSNLIRHLKHHRTKHDTECRVPHLQSELSSTHVSTVRTVPTGNSEYFVVKLHNVINFLQKPKAEIVICGHINTNLQKVSNNIVGILTCYGLDSLRTESQCGQIFQTHPDQAAAHPSSYTMGTRSFLGVKQPDHSVYHPLPSGAKVKEQSYTSTLPLYFHDGLWG